MIFVTAEELVRNPLKTDCASVVILGAGASIAACLNGDKNGKKIPLMNELPEIAGGSWSRLIKFAPVPDGDFEYQFSWIKNNGGYNDELKNVENIIESYFSSLELPDTATIYDYLVLSLRKKDIIATFNWDPFLISAHRRNRDFIELPDIRFLHGSVSYVTCAEHDVLGVSSEICPICDCQLVRSGLFYPDYEKDYSKDSIIFRDWNRVTSSLKKANFLTIFGYSGPKTDYMARKLILDNWRNSTTDRINYLEIIDIKEENEIYENWDGFFPYGHSSIHKSFWESTIFKYPRRISEMHNNASNWGKPTRELNPPKTDKLAELQKWYSDLASYE